MLLGSADARARLINQLDEALQESGADGINVDFENMPAERRDDMVVFIRDLATQVGEVVVAIPAVDWSNAWDVAGLAEHADLFLMGYDYHWATASRTGPNDPLFSDPDVSPWSLDRSIQAYLDRGAPPHRLLLGLPLYGYRWPIDPADPHADQPGAPTAGRATSVFWDEAASQQAEHGARWEPATRSPWQFHGDAQTWFSNLQSLTERVDHAQSLDLAGVGFWALNYDGQDPDLWRMIQQRTRPEPGADPSEPGPSLPGDDDALTLRVGVPLLAYPGDVVRLTATVDGLTPERWSWRQTEGPPVTLARDTTARPWFLVPEPGAYAFEVTPRQGDQALGQATSWVLAPSRAGLPERSCATAGGSGSGSALALALATLFGRRRSTPIRRHA